MEKSSEKFAKRLRAAMKASGYEAKPSVLEREFNLRETPNKYSRGASAVLTNPDC